MRPSNRKEMRGFTLVELMVGIVVGLLTVLAITETFALFEGNKRTTTGGATASENGLMASFLIERDVKVAGLGMSELPCANIRMYSAGASPTTQSTAAFAVSITQNTSALKNPPTATEDTDTIEITYSGSAVPAYYSRLQQSMANSDPTTPFRVESGISIKDKQLLLIYEEQNPAKDCSILQASADSTQVTTGGADAINHSNEGFQWNVPHASSSSYPFNPPAGSNIFPAGGYDSAKAKVTSMGTMVKRRYYISNNNLMVDEMITDGASAGSYTTQTLVNGIVSLKAAYGRDSDNNEFVDTWDNTAPATLIEPVALHIGVVARSGTMEKDDVTTGNFRHWEPNGPFYVISTSDQKKYRYKRFDTIIPLRNAIWGNNKS